MITQEKLKESLRYNEDTGVFYWVISKRPKVKAGEEAGYLCSQSGYVYISLNGKRYQAHRLAWLYVKGYLPTKRLDHDDQDKANNRITNLNEVTHQQNMRNMKMNKNNTSGVTGVRWSERLNKFRATIYANSRRHHLGCFVDKFEAICARKSADRKFGFNENHGNK